MNKDYELTSTKDGVILSNYIENSPEVIVPETIDGKRIVEIGRYAFKNHREIVTVSLPDSIKVIGSHAFYDCRKLSKIRIGEEISEIEDGAFKNCGELAAIELRVRTGKLTPLKSILSELNQEIEAMILSPDSDTQGKITARLLFPEYLYHYTEFTQAKIINQETYGTGIYYRECISDAAVDYRKYDELFCRIKTIEEVPVSLRIAMYRIAYPFCLLKVHEKQYLEFLREHVKDVILAVVEKNEFDLLIRLIKAGLCDKDTIDDNIDLIYEKEKIEWVSYLMQYKREMFGVQEKTFEL